MYRVSVASIFGGAVVVRLWRQARQSYQDRVSILSLCVLVHALLRAQIWGSRRKSLTFDNCSRASVMPVGFLSTLDNCSCLGFKTETIDRCHHKEPLKYATKLPFSADISCWLRLSRNHKSQFFWGVSGRKSLNFTVVWSTWANVFADPRQSGYVGSVEH